MQLKTKYQWWIKALSIFSGLILVNHVQAKPLLATAVIQSNQSQKIMVEGSVEAVKSSSIAPQVSGGVTILTVKVGDYVKAGQLLVRIDTRVANQQVVTNQAQLQAAQAQLSAARQEFERKKRLNEKQYISQAALERAESEFKTAEAQTKALFAQADVAKVQTGLHVINAPYDGVISEVMTEVGDMAMPGKPMITVYAADELRVIVNMPQSQLTSIKSGEAVHVMIPSAIENERHMISTQVTILPIADIVSNMTKIRLKLPKGLTSVRPGMFARAEFLGLSASKQVQLYVPAKAVIKRSELVAVYVLDAKGKPNLRQIRLGRKQGENYEVLSGLEVNEKVALDTLAAANYK